MENFSNSESSLLYPELSREEAIRRINLTVEAKRKAGISLTELQAWAERSFPQLPKALRYWDIPGARCEALLLALDQQDRDKFFDCLRFYSFYCRVDEGSCGTVLKLFFLAGIKNTHVCCALYRGLTGASGSAYGFHDWDEVIIRAAFYPSLRKARAAKAVAWLRAWEIAQLANKETTQGDK